MKREEAKKMATSRDCHCIKGKDRDTNYNVCIDKIFNDIEKQKRELLIDFVKYGCTPGYWEAEKNIEIEQVDSYLEDNK